MLCVRPCKKQASARRRWCDGPQTEFNFSEQPDQLYNDLIALHEGLDEAAECRAQRSADPALDESDRGCADYPRSICSRPTAQLISHRRAAANQLRHRHPCTDRYRLSSSIAGWPKGNRRAYLFWSGRPANIFFRRAGAGGKSLQEMIQYRCGDSGRANRIEAQLANMCD